MQNSIKLPFKMAIYGRSGTGKSYLIFEQLKKWCEQDIVDVSRVILFSKTHKSDEEQQKFIRYAVKKKKNFLKANCSENINMDFIEFLYEKQKEMKEKGLPIKNWVLVNDDQISAKILSDNTMTDVFCIGRHFLLSLIYLLQNYTRNLNSTNKNQFTNVLIGQLNNQEMVEDMLMDYSMGAGLTKRDALRAMFSFYLDAIKSHNNHGFLHIHTERSYGDSRLEKNFDGYFYDNQNGSTSEFSESNQEIKNPQKTLK